ncbi:MAG: hypothetical protein JO353_00405 [Phycisphaerae bacterium]|nr:hypothetical protein [Phycisphaerae bacterium]
MSLTYEQQKALAMQWKNAEPALRKMLYADIRRQNNAEVILSMSELSRHVLKQSPSRVPTGFIEMYRILLRQHRK